MKWVYLLIVLIVGGYLVYHFTGTPKPAAPTSPIGTATIFIDAAYADDAGKIRSICAPSAAEHAVQVAGQIRQGSATPQRFKWQNTASTQPDRSAVTSVFMGRVFTIEFTEEGGNYKIVACDLAQ